MIIFFDKDVKRIIKRIVVGVWALCIFLVGLPMELYASERLSMYSKAYALMDADTGRVLTGKNESEAMANASTTKILTCIVALESAELTEVVRISSNAASQPKVRLGVKAGENYPLKDMLYALMLESYNDCAVAIAEHIAGSVEEFAKLLNRKAAEIGCVDTYFITPNGLDAENEENFHHTTAQDLCRIMAYCTWESPKKDLFLQITQTRSYSGSSNGRSYQLINRNSFLDQMDGVLSGKTGYTAKAGYCYVAALEENGEKYCIALLACGWPNNKTYKWKDATKLFQYGLNKYSKQEISGKRITDVLRLDGRVEESGFQQMNQKMCLLIAGDTDSVSVLMKEEEKVHEEIEIYTDVELPIRKGQVLGEYRLFLDNMLLEEKYLYAESDMVPWNIGEILECILAQFVALFS